MKDYPIIFSGPMVRALLAGTKFQTRRILNPQPRKWEAQVIDITEPMLFDEDKPDKQWGQWETIWNFSALEGRGEPDREVWRPIKHYPIGTRLWVRETWGVGNRPCPVHGWVDGIEFRADCTDDDAPPLWDIIPADVESDSIASGWRPSIFMPRWASRLTLTVTDVRVQRLQDISEDDAVAEGVDLERYVPVSDSAGLHSSGEAEPTDPVEEYRHAWDRIHDAGAWQTNPWVAAYSFTVERKNIGAKQ